MDLRKAKIMAEVLMKMHGLTDLGWKFRFDRAKIRFGVCRYRTKEICLSSYLTFLNDEDRVKDVIAHEIAHQISYSRYDERGHGNSWKKVCIEIGAKPERCYDELTARPTTKYKLICPKCGKTYYRHKKPRNGRIFYHCSRNKEDRLILVLNND